MKRTKLTKLERLKFLQEKFPDFYKALEEAKLATDILYEELDELQNKLNDIREKLEEIEDLKNEVNSE